MTPDETLDAAARWLAARLNRRMAETDIRFYPHKTRLHKKKEAKNYSHAEAEALEELQRLGLVRKISGRDT